MNWEVVVANAARRAIRDMPRPQAEQIIEALEEMRTDPYTGDIKFLRGFVL